MAEGITVVRACIYVCMEGPQFSTLAESLTFENLRYSVIGMTNMPEAKLARGGDLLSHRRDGDRFPIAGISITTPSPCRTSSGCSPPMRRRPSGWWCGRARFSARARTLSDRLRPRARQRPDHRAGGARSGAIEETRRCGRQRA